LFRWCTVGRGRESEKCQKKCHILFEWLQMSEIYRSGNVATLQQWRIQFARPRGLRRNNCVDLIHFPSYTITQLQTTQKMRTCNTTFIGISIYDAMAKLNHIKWYFIRSEKSRVLLVNDQNDLILSSFIFWDKANEIVFLFFTFFKAFMWASVWKLNFYNVEECFTYIFHYVALKSILPLMAYLSFF